jgi:hypothetical protein
MSATISLSGVARAPFSARSRVMLSACARSSAAAALTIASEYGTPRVRIASSLPAVRRCLRCP